MISRPNSTPPIRYSTAGEEKEHAIYIEKRQDDIIAYFFQCSVDKLTRVVTFGEKLFSDVRRILYVEIFKFFECSRLRQTRFLSSPSIVSLAVMASLLRAKSRARIATIDPYSNAGWR